MSNNACYNWNGNFPPANAHGHAVEKLRRKNEFNAVDKLFISQLSLQCPFVAGNAVYKARSINYFLNPYAIYDDMKICNAVGVYKQDTDNNCNQCTSIDYEEESLTQIKANPDVMQLKESEMIVYPKPASNSINIKYNEKVETEFRIIDITGRIVMKVLLSNDANKVSVNVENLSSGVYTYQQLGHGKLKNSGKLIIE